MIKKIWNRILNTLVICLLACMGSYDCVEASAEDYVITPVITDKSLEGDEGHFDLTIDPSRKQHFEVEVQNNTDHDAIVYTGLITTVIGEGGAVEYIGPGDRMNSAFVKLSELVTSESEIIIPAGKSYVFEFTASMPAEGLEVQVSGELLFLVSPQQLENGIEEDWRNLIAETDVYSYSLPVVITAGENAAIPALNLKDILAEDGAGSIKAIIQNDTSISADRVSIEAAVRKKGKKAVLFESSQKDIKIPEHFDYEFTIVSKGKELEPGEYTLHMEVSIGSTRWQWDKDFNIEAENSADPGADYQETNTAGEGWHFNRFYIIMISLIILAAGAVIGGMALYLKKQKEEEAIIEIIKEMLKTI